MGVTQVAYSQVSERECSSAAALDASLPIVENECALP